MAPVGRRPTRTGPTGVGRASVVRLSPHAFREPPCGERGTTAVEIIPWSTIDDVPVWHDRFDDSKTTGWQSDAYWIGIFLGIILGFFLTFVVAFVVVPGQLLTEVLPLVFVVAIIMSYLLARLLSRTFSGIVARRLSVQQ